MCHSVEMYMPNLARRAAEHRLGAADFAAARRERAVVGAGQRVLARLGRLPTGAWRAVSRLCSTALGQSTLKVNE